MASGGPAPVAVTRIGVLRRPARGRLSRHCALSTAGAARDVPHDPPAELPGQGPLYTDATDGAKGLALLWERIRSPRRCGQRTEAGCPASGAAGMQRGFRKPPPLGTRAQRERIQRHRKPPPSRERPRRAGPPRHGASGTLLEPTSPTSASAGSSRSDHVILGIAASTSVEYSRLLERRDQRAAGAERGGRQDAHQPHLSEARTTRPHPGRGARLRVRARDARRGSAALIGPVARPPRCGERRGAPVCPRASAIC